MLLTGYDAEVLKVMYLDKVMKDHQLLQAVARVNRPREGKIYGIVVDIPGFLIENYIKAITQYQIYEDKSIREDIAKYLFVEAEKLWNSFLRHYEEFKNMFKDITSLEWEDFIKDLKEGKLTREDYDYVISTISLSPKLSGLLLKIKEALDLFNSVGAYPQKIDYYERIGWMEILRASLMRKRSPKRADIPWDRIKKSIIDKLSFDPFEEAKSINIDEAFIERTKGGKHIVILVADLLYSLIEEVEDKRDLVYRELYERLKELKNEYMNKEKSAEEILESLLKIKKEKENMDITLRSLSKEDKIIFNIKYILRSKGYTVNDLKKTKDALNQLLERKVISPTLWDELKKALHIDLISSIKDTSKRDKFIKLLVEELIKPYVGV